MPGMSGLELCEALAAAGDAIPTVLVTAYSEEITQRARAQGRHQVLPHQAVRRRAAPRLHTRGARYAAKRQTDTKVVVDYPPRQSSNPCAE